MKIVIAPDSFKGSLSAFQACVAIASGIRRVAPDAEIVMLPMADGGEGTAEALVESTGGKIQRAYVTGPLGEPIEAGYGILGRPEDGGLKTAAIEMAEAAGLTLVPIEKRNPLNTTTYGVGELVVDAFDKGCREFIIAIGGSATNDCGTGMAQSLGVKFFDSKGKEITFPMTGAATGEVDEIEIGSMDPRIAESKFTIACDVRNPLLGLEGASFIYGPQKGADEGMVKVLDANMEHIIGVIEKKVGRKVREIPGSGAAGGLGAGLLAFFGARLESGIDLVMRKCQFSEKIRGAGLIITGEGQIDATTVSGKTIAGIASEAKKQSIPVIALAGSVGSDARKVHEIGVNGILSICSGPILLDEAIGRASELLNTATEEAFRLVNTELKK